MVVYIFEPNIGLGAFTFSAEQSVFEVPRGLGTENAGPLELSSQISYLPSQDNIISVDTHCSGQPSGVALKTGLPTGKLCKEYIPYSGKFWIGAYISYDASPHENKIDENFYIRNFNHVNF